MIIPVPVFSVYNNTRVGEWFYHTRIEHRKPTKKYADRMLFFNGYREYSWITPVEGWDEYWKNHPNQRLQNLKILL